MAAEDDIIQRIVLQGDKQVIAQFNAIGNAGQDAFNAAGKAAEVNSAKFAKSGSAFADIVSGFRGTQTAAEDAGAGLDVANKKGLNLATTLRLLGRATGVRELSRLGGAARALGKAFEIALPAIVIVGLEKLGGAGAKAASDFDNLAASLKITNPEMQSLQAIGNASGLSFTELGDSLKSVDKLTKETATNAASNTKEYNKLKGELDDTATKADDLAVSFNKVAKESQKSAGDFAKSIRDIGQASIDSNGDFNKSLAKIQQQRNDIINGAPSAQEQRTRQLADLNDQEASLRDKQTRDLQKSLDDQIKATKAYQDAQEAQRLELRKLNQEQDANIKKEAEVRRQMAEARIEAERNATALEKLGIVATDSTGKLKKAPEVLFDIARALGSISDPTKQLAIEQDLINAGIDRKLIPALRRGEAAFKSLQATSKNINPGFTPKQIADADKFSIAVGQVGDALQALFKQAGIAIAPDFVGVFESLRDLFVEIRPGVVQFVKALADLLTPALKLIVDIIRNFIVPAFALINKGLQAIADLINKTFGTNLTGMDLFVVALLSIGAALRGGIILIQLIVIAIGVLAQQLSKVDFSKFGKNAKATFDGIVKSAQSGVQGVVNVWNSITGFFTGLWQTVTQGSQSVWDGIVQLASAGAQALTDVWNSVAQFFTDLWTSITDAGKTVWDTIAGFATNAVTTIETGWNALVQFFTDIYTGLAQLAQTAWTFVSDQANTAVTFITGIFRSLAGAISSIFDGIKTTITNTWNAVKDFIKPLTDFFSGGSASGSGGGSSTPAFAGGGPIHGPGSGTSDSVPIWASAGEWIMKHAAVRKYGSAFMDAINSLRLDPDALHFAVGGMVPFAAPQPRLAFAQGGQVPSRKNVLNLTIGEETFSGLSASDKTMDNLTRFATNRQIRSAGRKPSWHGG